jgi:hypothetical protein
VPVSRDGTSIHPIALCRPPRRLRRAERETGGMRLHSGSGIELGSEMQCVYGQSEHSPPSPDWALRSPTVMMLASEMQGVVYL